MWMVPSHREDGLRDTPQCTNGGFQLGWLITFIAAIIAATKNNTPVPHFAWWVIPYLLMVIVGVILVVGSESADIYQSAVRESQYKRCTREPWIMADALVDCGMLGHWLCVLVGHGQQSGLRIGCCERSGGGRTDIVVDGHGMEIREAIVGVVRADVKAAGLDLLFWIDDPSEPPQLH